MASRNDLGPPGYREAASFGGRRRGADLRGAGRRRQGRVHADAARAPLRGLHLARAALQGRRDQRVHDPLHAGRPAVRLRRAAQGRRARARRSTPRRRGGSPKTARRTRWNVDLSKFALVEQGQERRPSGRVDHTFTYERASESLGEGRYRLRLVVSGDRLTEVTHFIKIPEAFTRRYASMRSANEIIGIGSDGRPRAPLRDRRHRRRHVLHDAAALRAVDARRGDLGRRGRRHADAGVAERASR